ncbi:YcaO-like family protein [Halocatena pleomorpha]|uniref:Bacteriocin biosynthesis protein SagD n=1 Tax=Halocatena pleomorpha TaxID=1785090 RepID=A0A3P3R9S9_9EURY|nr:YcaO-like family protein [Halocatena pleomorpha]RRJ29223.1 bacteriocin biosynthesis protein SagD [Halocatena pleomorpha]
MSVTVVGSGPAVDAIEAAVSDIDHDTSVRSTVESLDDDLAVVVGTVGSDVFSTANETARSDGTPWIAVELGGIGGYAHHSVDVAVSGYGASTACFDCLRTRVRSGLDDSETETSDIDPETARFGGALAGREAVRAVSGSSSLFGSVVEIPHAQRRIHPVPGCSCTGRREWTLSSEYEERSIQAALERAERAVDDRIGLIHEVGEVESFPVPYYLARLANTTGFSDVQASQQAAGVALGWDEAFMKALGEGLERYCAGVYDTDDLPTARASDLSIPILPSAFVRPDDPDDAAPTAWVPGEDLHTGETVSLPGARVLFPFDGPGPTITTGLGLGSSGAAALIAGLTEIIERDGALLAWYSTYEPLELAIDDEEYETLVARAKAEGLSVTASLLTQDIDVPVVGVAVHRDEEWPAFALGLAADLDPVAAARSACTEALQNWTELRRMGKADAQNAGGRIGHFASRPPATEEFTAPEQTIPAASVAAAVSPGQDALNTLLDRLSDAGLNAYAARLTTPDVDALGFEAVRVLVPQAQPLFVGEPYFGERARTVPAELGFEPRLRREHHPYP